MTTIISLKKKPSKGIAMITASKPRRGLRHFVCLAAGAALVAGGLTVAPMSQVPAAAVDTAKILYCKNGSALYLSHALDGNNRTIKRMSFYTGSTGGSASVRVPGRVFPYSASAPANSSRYVTINVPASKGAKVTGSITTDGTTCSANWTL